MRISDWSSDVCSADLMKVLAKHENRIECEVLTRGTLRSRRHINLPGVKVNLPALTAKDLADIAVGLELQVDYIALSSEERRVGNECVRTCRSRWSADH